MNFMLSEENANVVYPENDLIDTTPIGWFERKLFAEYPALLVGVYKGSSEEPRTREYLQELQLLAQTHGIEVIEALAFSIRTFSAATFLSEGKLAELKAKGVITEEEFQKQKEKLLG